MCVCVCVCVCVCTCLFYICCYSSLEVVALALRFEWKIEYADLTDWLSFLPTSYKTRELQQDGGIMMFLIHKVATSIVRKNSR